MKKMNYIYKVSAAVAFAAAMILSASCSKERQFKGDVTGSAEVRFEASVVSGTTSVTTKSGVLTGADGISIPFTMVSEPGINGGAGDAIDTKGTLYNTTGEDMALAAAGIEKFRVVAFNSDYTYFIPAMTDVNYADGKWSTATPYTWAGGEYKAFCAIANFDGDVTVTVEEDGPVGSFVQTIPDQAKDQKEFMLTSYVGNGDSDGDGVCDGVVPLTFDHLSAGVVFKMGTMLDVSAIKRISIENVIGTRTRIYKQEGGVFVQDDFIDGDTKTVWQDIEGSLPAVGEIIGEPFILNAQSTQNVILHVYVTIFGKDYDLVAHLDDVNGWDPGCTSVYTLGFSDTLIEPLCFTSDGPQTVYFNRKKPDSSAPNLEYSTDRANWTEWEDPTAPVEFDGTLYLRGLNPNGFRAVEDFSRDTEEGFIFGNQDVPVTLSGNQMSIIDYRMPVDVPSRGCFSQLYIFQECIKSAAELELPATGLTDYCYSYMFQICTNLEDAPELPAMNLSTGCYMGMFDGCESLKECPALPATGLADDCYNYMFHYCLSLEETCSLPATKMFPGCYMEMFAECELLKECPALPATKLAERCYSEMFMRCPKFVTAPELPATKLAAQCYKEMFGGCRNLSFIKMLATDISAEDCLKDWTYSVAETGTFVKDSALQTGTGTNQIPLDSRSGIPTGWTVYDIIEPVVEPLCITAEDEQSVIFVRMRYNDNTEKTSQLGYPDATIFYSFDKKQWVEWTDFSESVTFGTGEHPSIYLIGSNPDGFGGIYDSENRTYDGSVLYFLHENTEINISGNIMSLIDYSEKLTEFPAGTSGHFAGLFAYAPVRSAADLVLPVNTLSTLCYTGMFAFCSKLQTPPALPAKTMAPYCYHNLFYGCSSLATAPEMPAMNLASYCYWGMYKFCSSLTTAPALPAETLADNCYRDMFGCCTGLQTAPVLPAKTLAEGCYRYMFEDCTNLNYIKMLATDITATDCLYDWTYSVAEKGTFVKNPALKTGTGTNQIRLDSDSGIPEGWDFVDATE